MEEEAEKNRRWSQQQWAYDGEKRGRHSHMPYASMLGYLKEKITVVGLRKRTKSDYLKWSDLPRIMLKPTIIDQ